MPQEPRETLTAALRDHEAAGRVEAEWRELNRTAARQPEAAFVFAQIVRHTITMALLASRLAAGAR